MGIFDFLEKTKNAINTNSISNNNIPLSQKINKLNNGKASDNSNLNKHQEKVNTYELSPNEAVIHDNGQARNYETSIKNRIVNYNQKICPYCNKVIEILPAKMKQCNKCGNYVFVTKSYLNPNQNMLITSQEHETLKSYRTKFLELKTLSLKLSNMGITNNDFNKKYRQLGNKATYIDILWELYNDKSNEYFYQYNLGLHRNVQLLMADILVKEKNFKYAIETLLYICYLDINGARNNANDIIDAFDPNIAFISPGIVRTLKKCIIQSSMSLPEVRSRFFKLATRHIPTPLSIEQSWNILYKNLATPRG